MANEKNAVIDEAQVKTFRWLFYISLFQLLACFIFPAILFSTKILFYIEILNALTVGLLFGLYFLGVNLYGTFVDRRRRPIYVALIIFVSMWAIWTTVTWLHIEHMHYLT
jgi:hypothetical protein